jgi:hypothetical protein
MNSTVNEMQLICVEEEKINILYSTVLWADFEIFLFLKKEYSIDMCYILPSKS